MQTIGAPLVDREYHYGVRQNGYLFMGIAAWCVVVMLLLQLVLLRLAGDAAILVSALMAGICGCMVLS